MVIDVGVVGLRGWTTWLDVVKGHKEWPRVLAHDFAVGRRRSGGKVAENGNHAGTVRASSEH